MISEILRAITSACRTHNVVREQRRDDQTIAWDVEVVDELL